MNSLIKDIRYGSRTLWKRPALTITAVLTLALGIGATTAIFSVVNAVLLRPLPFKEPDRLIMISERRLNSHDANLPISAHEYAAWRERTHSFEALTLIQPNGLNLTGRGDAVTVKVARVSAEFFNVIGVPPLAGRTFAPDEDQSGGAKVAVLGHKLWIERFGADRNVINQTISLGDQTYTVIGIMPALELIPDVVLPIDLRAEVRMVGKHSNQVMGRLKPGVTLDQAQSDLVLVSQQLEQEMPDANKGHGVQTIPLLENVTGSVQQPLLILFGAVAFVLLIACVNVANLLLARATARRKEMAIRTALGAGRWRLIRQTLIESLILSAFGGLLGLLSAIWLMDLFSKITSVNLPRLGQLSMDRRVLLATVGFSLFTGVLTGIAPAWRNSEPRLFRSINEGARESTGRSRIGSALVVVEVALAVVLLVGGGLMMKSFVRLINVDPGFDPHQVLRLDLGLDSPKYRQPQQQKAFYEELIPRLKALPGVETVGATTITPLGHADTWIPFAVEGRPAPPPGAEQQAAVRVVNDDFFRALRIPLRAGRFFNQGDTRVAVPLLRYYEQQPYPAHFDEPQAAPAVIINDTMAKLYWPNEDPLGKRCRVLFSPWITVVGVVGDVHHSGLNTPPFPEMYLSDLQEPTGYLAVLIRTSGDPLQLATAAREQIKAVDKDQPVIINTMDDVLSDSVAGQRFNTLLLGGFAALALVLAMIGVFGVINYSVTQRTQELGIRIALGARTANIVSLILRQGLILVLIGLLVGSLAAVALTRVIAGLLFGVSPTDAATFVIVSLLMTAVALVACYVPARRATKVDPLIALRYE